MTRWKAVVVGATLIAAAGIGPDVVANDHDERVPQRVTVSFGTGLNTAASLNHHVVPQIIKVRTTLATAATPAIPGVVNFVVAGFHQIFVYNPGVTPGDILAFLAANDPTNSKLFINDLNNLFYTGINPVRL